MIDHRPEDAHGHRSAGTGFIGGAQHRGRRSAFRVLRSRDFPTDERHAGSPVLNLRAMRGEDLPLVEHWLSVPHVARWYLAGSTLEQEIGDVRDSVEGRQPVQALVAFDGESAIGWCQWYLCAVDPAWAADVAAGPGDVGIDYAIAVPELVGHGVGTRLVADLVRLVRAKHAGCAVLADPDERNTASRRVLEKNGFELVAVRSLPSEPTDDPVAIYRLARLVVAGRKDSSDAPSADADEEARTEPKEEEGT